MPSKINKQNMIMALFIFVISNHLNQIAYLCGADEMSSFNFSEKYTEKKKRKVNLNFIFYNFDSS